MNDYQEESMETALRIYRKHHPDSFTNALSKLINQLNNIEEAVLNKASEDEINIKLAKATIFWHLLFEEASNYGYELDEILNLVGSFSIETIKELP